jgi:hypothetical protein
MPKLRQSSRRYDYFRCKLRDVGLMTLNGHSGVKHFCKVLQFRPGGTFGTVRHHPASRSILSRSSRDGRRRGGRTPLDAGSR